MANIFISIITFVYYDTIIVETIYVKNLCNLTLCATIFLLFFFHDEIYNQLYCIRLYVHNLSNENDYLLLVITITPNTQLRKKNRI